MNEATETIGTQVVDLGLGSCEDICPVQDQLPSCCEWYFYDQDHIFHPLDGMISKRENKKYCTV